MDNESNDELLFADGIPIEEIDEPLNFSQNDGDEDLLEVQRMKADEKDKDRKEKRYFSAFRLIVGCLIFLGCIYIVDVIMAALLNQTLRGITDSIIEIIKTLLFTLSGYLFARKENGD